MKLLGRRPPLGRSFRLVWLSVAISSTGDGMFLTAFPLLAATLTRSPVVIAGVTVALTLPWLLFSLISGGVADRIDRRRLMVIADVARAALVGVLGAVVLFDAAQIWLLYLCAFGLGTAETLHANSAQALFPLLVDEKALVPANARLTGTEVVTERFVGPPMGAALFGLAPAVPFVLDSVTFAASAGLAAALPPVHQVGERTTRLWTDIREGLRYTVRHPVLRQLAVLLGVLNFFYLGAEGVLILFTIEELDAGSAVYTAMFVAGAAGMLATQWLVTPLQRRIGSARTIAVALWLWTIAMVGLALESNAIAAVALFVVLGMGDGLWKVLTVSIRQTITPNRLLGRVNSAYRMVGQGARPLGALFGGLVARAFGVRGPFVVAAVVFVVIALCAPVILRPVRKAQD